MEKIRVLLVDDHAILREGIVALLSNETNIEVVGEAANGDQAIECAKKLKPSVTLMDISMPMRNGLHASSLILRELPESKIIFLSMSDNKEFISQALQLGASGYLLKETISSELIEAIREVNKGNAFFSPPISKILIEIHREEKNQKNRLTLREREVLQLVAEGKSNKEISSLLNIGVKTIEKYRTQLMKKLDIHDAVGLTRYAIARGIVKL